MTVVHGGGSGAAGTPGGSSARPHRPALFADLTEMIDAAGGASAVSRAELASATADVVVRAGRGGSGPDGHAVPDAPAGPVGTPAPDDDRFVALADEVGLDTLAALWRDADPVSLPGALWILYLVRQWCRSDPDDVVRLWRAGEPLAPADAAVAGAASYADATDITRLADAVLGGVYRGDLAVALERAAAFFRVVAAGRRALAGTPEPGAVAATAADLAERNDRAAAALTAAAARWRAGSLR